MPDATGFTATLTALNGQRYQVYGRSLVCADSEYGGYDLIVQDGDGTWYANSMQPWNRLLLSPSKQSLVAITAANLLTSCGAYLDREGKIKLGGGTFSSGGNCE